MAEFICTQCEKDPSKLTDEHCKVQVTYDGYGEYPTGCLYESMRKEGYTGDWKRFTRKKKVSS